MNMNPQLMKLVGLMERLAFRLTTAEEMPPEERVALQGYIEFINALNKANLQDPEEYPWRDQQDGYSKTIRKLIGHFPIVTPVDNDMRVLLERRSDNGKWSLPSGIIEPGETAKTGVVRELHEEAGLMVDEEDLRLFDEFSGKQHIYPHGDIIYISSSAFGANLSRISRALNCSGSAWVNCQKTPPDQRGVLQRQYWHGFRKLKAGNNKADLFLISNLNN